MANLLKKEPTPHINNTEPTPEPSLSSKGKGKAFDADGILTQSKQKRMFGFFILFFSLILFVSILSFIFTWRDDFDKMKGGFVELFLNDISVDNIFGRYGLWLSYYVCYIGFGIPAVIISYLSFLLGGLLFFKNFKKFSLEHISFCLVVMLYASTALAFVFQTADFPYGGYVGVLITDYLSKLMGQLGLGLLLVCILLAYVFWATNWVINYGNVVERIKKYVATPATPSTEAGTPETPPTTPPIPNEAIEVVSLEQTPTQNKLAEDYVPKPPSEISMPATDSEAHTLNMEIVYQKLEELNQITPLPITASAHTLSMPSEEPEEEEILHKDLVEFDVSIPTATMEEPNEEEMTTTAILEKENTYTFPPISLLNKPKTEEITYDTQELEANKQQIIQTLKNFKINIQKITATIGPTVTLYEIIPEDGTRISKIKNLEDDIALSLAALGIRIIAPMPGKGTIGIEVPNKQKQMVSLRSLLRSAAYQDNTHILPIAFGKAIDNTDYIVDLAKMPHVLMAGATGQGKSVGLNALLISLLYKKHPADLKLVLIDPKKVELSLFKKLEKHFLAKLPGEDEPIITDTKKVIGTLNALCLEMDNRYDVLKEAYCKNIVEYNEKIKNKQLNAAEGHQHLPYIVIVIDEFADLIMTAGKEIELPIARIAQLARAVGIHLVIATQRPSVNIITGMIKANFPARVAFKVSSKIDSRTILDEGGADQLIGKGDMLISNSGSLTRLQCAFVDTAEVENVCDFIAQQAKPTEDYYLPLVEESEEEGGRAVEFDDRDPLFEEVARFVVGAQSGSTSHIQRKMRLGFNRAGRLMDQLEAAGIVSAARGSKPREVLIKTEADLQEVLRRAV